MTNLFWFLVSLWLLGHLWSAIRKDGLWPFVKPAVAKAVIVAEERERDIDVDEQYLLETFDLKATGLSWEQFEALPLEARLALAEAHR